MASTEDKGGPKVEEEKQILQNNSAVDSTGSETTSQSTPAPAEKPAEPEEESKQDPDQPTPPPTEPTAATKPEEKSDTATKPEEKSDTATKPEEKSDTATKPEVKSDTKPAAEQTAAKPAQIPMPAPAKQRYDWYQTETHVTVTILIKRAKKEDVQVDLTQNTLSATVKLPTGNDYSLELDLAHPIVPEKSSTKVLSSKIEVRMKKEEGLRWNKLEGEDEIPKPAPVAPSASAGADAHDAIHKYPTSSHVTRNWDKIAKDFEKDEEENAKGEAALNSLFQKIYESGDDETKKAMNKSFSESAGTVLSTNWTDIGKAKTDVKPPDGMEHRKWET